MARPVKGPELVEKLTGTEEAKERLKTIIKTVSGQLTIAEACQELGVGRSRFFELRDERVVLSADYLPPGTYTYTYLARAGTPGTFRVIPPTAQEFYFPEVYGRGAGSLFSVLP